MAPSRLLQTHRHVVASAADELRRIRIKYQEIPPSSRQGEGACGPRVYGRAEDRAVLHGGGEYRHCLARREDEQDHEQSVAGRAEDRAVLLTSTDVVMSAADELRRIRMAYQQERPPRRQGEGACGPRVYGRA